MSTPRTGGSAFDRVTDALRADGRKVSTPRDGEARAKCPAHNGNSDDSLSVKRTEDRALIYCHSGCDRQDVLAALGMTDGDLFDEQRTSYTYPDPLGSVLRTVTRTYDGGRRRFRQDVHDKGVTPLYRLPELAAHPRDEIVYLVEGEEDVHAIEAAGGLGTTAPQGASNFHRVDVEPLRGRLVVAVVDRDEAGAKWAAAVADKLDGVTAGVSFCQARTGKDFSDHLAAGHGLDDLDPYENAQASPDGAQGLRQLILTCAAQIKPRPVRWLWDGRLALGTLGLLAGREGLGKSTLAYWTAARITRGELPGAYREEPRAVLICATEDSWEHTIVPRLMAAGADLTRVFRVEVVTVDEIHVGLSLPRDLIALEDAAAHAGAALLLLDPLMSRLGDLDTHRDAEVRQALEPLVSIADRTGMSILGLIHHNKGGSTDPLQLVMGSKAFTAVARSVHTVVPHPDDEERRVFGTPKNNLGRTNLPSLTFTLAGHPIDTEEGTAWTGRIEWGDDLDESIGEVMRRAVPDEDRTATDEAIEWLQDFLVKEGGSASSGDIKRAGKVVGHSERTLGRARRALHLTTTREGFPSVTSWTLPVATPVAPKSLGDGTTGTTGTTVPRGDISNNTTCMTENEIPSRASRASRATSPGVVTPLDGTGSTPIGGPRGDDGRPLPCPECGHVFHSRHCPLRRSA